MSEAPARDGLAEVRASTRGEWRAWLAEHHAQRASVWLIYPKRGEEPGDALAAFVEESLCFGWVDSLAHRVDDDWSMIRMSPRKPSSGWSRVNKQRVARLEAGGAMTSAGRAAIDRAQANGAWSALDVAESLEPPPDLARALRANRLARRHFDAFPPSSRKIILAWVTTAKRPETRAARIAETVRLAEQNVRANHR